MRPWCFQSLAHTTAPCKRLQCAATARLAAEGAAQRRSRDGTAQQRRPPPHLAPSDLTGQARNGQDHRRRPPQPAPPPPATGHLRAAAPRRPPLRSRVLFSLVGASGANTERHAAAWQGGLAARQAAGKCTTAKGPGGSSRARVGAVGEIGTPLSEQCKRSSTACPAGAARGPGWRRSASAARWRRSGRRPRHAAAAPPALRRWCARCRRR